MTTATRGRGHAPLLTKLRVSVIASSARFLFIYLFFKRHKIEPARPFLIFLTGKLGSLWWENRSGILPGKLLWVSN